MFQFQSQRRLFLSLRHHFYSSLKLNSPIFGSSFASLQNPNPNPNPISPPFSVSTLFTPRHLISFNSSPLLSNGVRIRTFATRLSDSSSNRSLPRKETIMLEGCDFEHWLVVVKAPESNLTRDEIIDGYIKTLARVIGSEEEARMKIYSVSTQHYYAFGALVSEELADKLRDQPHVQWVLPDSYQDVKNKTYAGEPFINGQPVPYDPKYHEIWLHNREQSLKNNTKHKRKQRDPNPSRQRPSPLLSASAPHGMNQSLMPAAGPQNQDLQPSNMQNQTPEPSSHPNFPCHTFMSSAGSPCQRPPQSQIHNSSCQSFSHSQAPQISHTQNNSSSWTSSSPQSTRDLNNQSWGNHNLNWSPVKGSQNQATNTEIQKQTVSPSSTSAHTPAWNGQSHSWDPASGYRSKSSQPQPCNNNYTYNNFPPSAGATDMPSHMLNPDIPEGPPVVQPFDQFCRDTPQSASQNGYPPESLERQQYRNNYNNRQSSNTMVSPQGDWNYQNTNMTPSGPTRGMPPQVRLNNHSNRDFPLHVQNCAPQNGYTSDSFQHRQYQNSYNTGQSSNSMASPQGEWNYQNMNMTPSVSSQGMPPQVHPDNHYRDFTLHGQNSCNDEQSSYAMVSPQGESTYPNMNMTPSVPSQGMPPQCRQDNKSHRDIPDHVQNGVSQNGHQPVSLEHQQYRRQSPSAMVFPQGDWNYQSVNMTPSFPARSVPELAHVQNGVSQDGYPLGSLDHQQYKTSYNDRQSSHAMVSPPGDWNYQNSNMAPSAPARNIPSDMKYPNFRGGDLPSPLQQNGYSYRDHRSNAQNGCLQNDHPAATLHCQQYQRSLWHSQQITSFPNTNIAPQILNHQSQGADVPIPVHNNEYQCNFVQAGHQVDNFTADSTRSCNSSGAVQTREYQERDMPTSEEYVYSSI